MHPQSRQHRLVCIANPPGEKKKTSQLPDSAANLQVPEICSQTFTVRRLLRSQHVNKCRCGKLFLLLFLCQAVDTEPQW